MATPSDVFQAIRQHLGSALQVAEMSPSQLLKLVKEVAAIDNPHAVSSALVLCHCGALGGEAASAFYVEQFRNAKSSSDARLAAAAIDRFGTGSDAELLALEDKFHHKNLAVRVVASRTWLKRVLENTRQSGESLRRIARLAKQRVPSLPVVTDDAKIGTALTLASDFIFVDLAFYITHCKSFVTFSMYAFEEMSLAVARAAVPSSVPAGFVGRMARYLTDGSYDEQVGAAIALCGLGEAAADHTARMIDVLNEAAPTRLRLIVWLLLALSEQGERAAPGLPAILMRAEGRNHFVYWMACRALSNIGLQASKAVPLLRKRLHIRDLWGSVISARTMRFVIEPESNQAWAVRGELLAQVRGEGKPQLRGACLLTLACLCPNDEHVIARTNSALEDDNPLVVWAGIMAVCYHGPSAASSVERLLVLLNNNDSEVRDAVRAAILSIEDDAAPIVVDALNSNDGVLARLIADVILTEHEFLLACLPHLAELLESEDAILAIMVAGILGETGPLAERYLPQLEDLRLDLSFDQREDLAAMVEDAMDRIRTEEASDSRDEDARDEDH